MTYCVGFLVRAGLVMMADTRTNAGVDNVSTYRKLRLHGNDGTRLIVTASAGSLSTTQDAVQRLQQAPRSEQKQPERTVDHHRRQALVQGKQ